MFSGPMDEKHGSSSGEEHHQHHRSRRTKHRQSRSTTGKPRGRPYGSKNKPKPPIIITRESPNTLRSHFMEIPATHDIVQALSEFAAKRQRGICILGATGTVTSITLRQPPPPTSAQPSSVLTFTGTFEILSMSGAFLPPPAPPPASGVSVFLSCGQGQVLGGKVVGPLLAAGLVVVMAASFANSPYERLPLLVEEVEELQEDAEKIHTPSNPHQDQLTNLIPTTTTSATAAALFHGLVDNAMPAEEFWGGAFAAGRPPQF